MKTIDLTKFSNDGFVFYFGGESEKISAISFSKALFYLIQATEIISDRLCIDSESDIEVSIKSVKPGSLSVMLAVVAGGILTISVNTISQVISGYILHKLNARTVKTDEANGKVTIELEVERKRDNRRNLIDRETLKVVMDKDAVNLLRDLESNSGFGRDISSAFGAMLSEFHIDLFDIRDSNGERETYSLPRSDIKTVRKNISEDRKKQSNYRDIKAVLQVRIPVLENTRRRWEFIMEDKKIMASVVDYAFFADLESGKISIRQGDKFKVILRVFGDNERYEIIKVNDIVNSNI